LNVALTTCVLDKARTIGVVIILFSVGLTL